MIIAKTEYKDFKEGFQRIQALQSQLESESVATVDKINQYFRENYQKLKKQSETEEALLRQEIEGKRSSRTKKIITSILVFLSSIMMGFSSWIIVIPIVLLINQDPMVNMALFLGLIGVCSGLSFLLAIISAIYFFVLITSPIKDVFLNPSIHLPTEYKVDLINKWISTISRLEYSGKTFGEKAEHGLLKHLSSNLPKNYFAILNLLIDTHLDADVVVVGPTGIWILESKYWQGLITYKEFLWSHKRDIFPYTTETIGDAEGEFPPHKQWLIESTCVRAILSKSEVAERQSLESWIRGGLVFTHPNSTLDIEISCPVECGTTSTWRSNIEKAPVIPELTQNKITEIVDTLLNYTNTLSPIEQRTSTIEIAEDVYQKEKRNIEGKYGEILSKDAAKQQQIIA